MFFCSCGGPLLEGIYIVALSQSRAELWETTLKFGGRGAGCDSEIDAQSKNCNRFGGDGATRFIPSTVGGHQRASEVSRPTLQVDRQTRTGQQGNAKRDNRENANRTTGRTRAGQRGKRERDNREDTKGAKMKTRTGLHRTGSRK